MFEGVEFPSPRKSFSRGEGQRTTTKKPKPEQELLPRWKRLTVVSRPKCQVCVAAMEAGGKWSAPMPTVWERTFGGVQDYYCYQHGADPRQADGLEGKPTDPGKRGK